MPPFNRNSMTEIRRQLQRAKFRLALNQFAMRLIWCLLAAALVATIAVVIPKIWHVPIIDSYGPEGWLGIWLGGGCGLAVVVAGIWTWLRPLNDDDVALEIDDRYGLRQRVVSSLMLSPADAEQPFGKALLEDTQRRVAVLEINEKFPFKMSPTAVLPLVAGAIVLTVMLAIPNATSMAVAKPAAPTEEQKLIKESAQQLKKKLAKRKQEAREKGLEDAEVLLEQIEQEAGKLATKPADRKQSLVKLNNLARDIEKRKQELGNVNDLKKQLQKLGDLEKGPAGKAGDALKNRDFDAAKKEVEKLKDKLIAGDFEEVDKKELQQQLVKIQEQLEEKAAQHAEAKENLKEQIEQALASGDRDLAGDLQQKLDELKQGDQQMEQLKQLGQQLADAAEQLQQGNDAAAAEQLGELAQQLDDLQQQFDEMELLDEAMQQIADCKNGMCKPGDQRGDQLAQGNKPGNKSGNGMGKGDPEDQPPGQGLGEGQGKGDRPENVNDTGFFDSQVDGDVKPGESIRTGSADGPNIAGRTKENVKKEIAASMASQDDPLTNRRIPKQDREHAREYFEQFRGGKDGQ
jgi:hypothetical protein